MVVGALLFAAGYFLCLFTHGTETHISPNDEQKEDEQYKYIKKAQPSYKSVLKPTITAYDKFKTTDGLYDVVSPNRKVTEKDRGED